MHKVILRISTGALLAFSLIADSGCPPTLPAISRIEPSPASAGAEIVISGVNFGGGGSVEYGGQPAFVVAWGGTEIRATVPTGLANGVYPVTVTPTGGIESDAVNHSLGGVWAVMKWGVGRWGPP